MSLHLEHFYNQSDWPCHAKLEVVADAVALASVESADLSFSGASDEFRSGLVYVDDAHV